MTRPLSDWTDEELVEAISYLPWEQQLRGLTFSYMGLGVGACTALGCVWGLWHVLPNELVNLAWMACLIVPPLLLTITVWIVDARSRPYLRELARRYAGATAKAYVRDLEKESRIDGHPRLIAAIFILGGEPIGATSSRYVVRIFEDAVGGRAGRFSYFSHCTDRSAITANVRRYVPRRFDAVVPAPVVDHLLTLASKLSTAVQIGSDDREADRGSCELSIWRADKGLIKSFRSDGSADKEFGDMAEVQMIEVMYELGRNVEKEPPLGS